MNIKRFGDALKNMIDPNDNRLIKFLIGLISLPTRMFPPNSNVRYPFIVIFFSLLTMLDLIFRPLLMFLPKITDKINIILNGNGFGSYKSIKQHGGLIGKYYTIIIDSLGWILSMEIVNLIPPLFILGSIISFIITDMAWYSILILAIFDILALVFIPPLGNLLAFFKAGGYDFLQFIPCLILGSLWLMPSPMTAGLENLFSMNGEYETGIGPYLLNAAVPNTMGMTIILLYIMIKYVGFGVFKTMLTYLQKLKPELLVMASIPFTYYMNDIWGEYTDKDIPTYMTVFCAIYWIYVRMFS
jgi:hypothetical protein